MPRKRKTTKAWKKFESGKITLNQLWKEKDVISAKKKYLKKLKKKR